jgi:HAMP domain-containing protein
MVLWIVIAVVLVGLLVLLLAAGSLVGRLRPLRRAARALLRRQAEAEKLQAAAFTLAQEAETLRLKAEITQERLALVKVKSGARGR